MNDRRDAPPRVELLSIGSELLLGETVDTNAAYLGAELASIGLPVSGVRMLPDERDVIRDAFREAIARCEVVVATGGLGPTHDDLTREGLADALGERLDEDPALLEVLEERFRGSGPMPAVNRRQAMRAPSAQTLANPIGSAPGWWVRTGRCTVVLLPGVPSEMRMMWSDHVRERLGTQLDAPPLATRIVKAFGIGESAMAERLAGIIDPPPAGVVAGIYARDDGVHVRFTTRGDGKVLQPLVQACVDTLGEDVYGTDGQTLPSVALDALGRLGISTLASWEAGTDGALLAILATAGPGPGTTQYAGGILDTGGASGPPVAEAVLQVSLMPQDPRGRSRVRVAVSGAMSLPPTEVRIHGSGPQRARRAAFAALDVVRRVSSSGR